MNKFSIFLLVIAGSMGVIGARYPVKVEERGQNPYRPPD